MKRHLLTILLILFTGWASAQTRKAYDLGADFGLTHLQSKMQVRNLVADTNAAKARYPQFYARRRNLGKTGAQFMNLSAFDAAFGEAVWQGQGGGGAGRA